MTENTEKQTAKRVTVAVVFTPEEWDKLNGIRHDMRIDRKGEFVKLMAIKGAGVAK